MANIEKIPGKSGVTYRITVAGGFDTSGHRIRHRMTYKPEPGMTARQIQKAVQRAAADFERSIEMGYQLDNRQTFAQYAEYVLNLKEHNGDLKIKTLDRYREYLPRINQAIGHILLVDLRPQHLNSFYKNLAEDGIRADNRRAVASVDLAQLLKEKNLTRAALARLSGLSTTTAQDIVRVKSVSLASAEAIAKALDKSVKDLFTVTDPGGGLSTKTIMGHHRLISSILSQAEKEMLVPYNAAKKASPPKIKKFEIFLDKMHRYETNSKIYETRRALLINKLLDIGKITAKESDTISNDDLLLLVGRMLEDKYDLIFSGNSEVYSICKEFIEFDRNKSFALFQFVHATYALAESIDKQVVK